MLVCFFDSGIGGLTLLNECSKLRKDCNFAYFADNYNMPYGSRTHEEILKLVDSKFSLMQSLNPAAAVVACNTVTAECIGFLRQKYSFPIVGIQPAIKPAASAHKKVAVLATPATAASEPIKKITEEYGGGHTSIIACPDLAAYIENNIFNIDKNKVIELLPTVDCDSIVLGCTHYIYISDLISDFYNCTVYDGVKGTVNQFDKILGITDHLNISRHEVTFYGGNYLKNAKVYEYLNNNKKFYQ